MIDAHTHAPTRPDWPARAAEAAAVGVTAWVMGGVDPADWAAQATVARDPRLHRTLGLHPAHLHHGLDPLRAALAAGPRPVAIGEIGLDRRCGPLGPQVEALRAQLDLARAQALPIVLHLVAPWDLALSTLTHDGPLPGGFVHAFTGSAAIAVQLAARGLALSFGPALLRSPRAQAAARALPAHLLLVETDDGPCRPAELAVIVRALAHLRGEDPAALAATTAANARRILALPETPP